MLSEEWGFLKSRVSEIHVKRIRVNQGVGENKLKLVHGYQRVTTQLCNSLH